MNFLFYEKAGLATTPKHSLFFLPSANLFLAVPMQLFI